MLTYGISFFAMKQMPEFASIFDKSLSFGKRFGNAMSMSMIALALTVSFGFPLMALQIVFEAVFNSMIKNKDRVLATV